MTPELTDRPTDHPPSAWEDLAFHYERLQDWSNAATAWDRAESASAGHNRRAGYAAYARKCREKLT